MRGCGWLIIKILDYLVTPVSVLQLAIQDPVVTMIELRCYNLCLQIPSLDLVEVWAILSNFRRIGLVSMA